MAYSSKILLDSISPAGHRLTTMEITLPRIVLAEFNTHRVFSRNSASSRAIPVEKIIKKVQDDPFIPVYWGKNQKGMSADQELTPEEISIATFDWLYARDRAIEVAKDMLNLGVHKQITNRLLEPWMWQTIIVTATKWDNYEGLRTDKNAQPEIQKSALLSKAARLASTPRYLNAGDWHRPLMDDFAELSAKYSVDNLNLISVGRCARVSYLTHNGVRDPNDDIRLANSLKENGHMSPFEHVARSIGTNIWAGTSFYSEPSGNFDGWRQYRKTIPGEDVFTKGETK